MFHTLSQSILACLLGALALFAAGGASAQTDAGGNTGATALATTDFNIFLESYNSGQKAWVQMNATQQAYFFNRARCECDGDTTNYTGYVKVAIKTAPGTSQKISALLTANFVSGGSARLYASGSSYNCLAPANYVFGLESYCLNLLNPTLGGYSTGIDGGMAFFESNNLYESPPIPIAWLFGALWQGVCGTPGTSCDSTSTCTNAASLVTISFWAQTTANAYPDLMDLSLSVTLVGVVSYVPTSVTAEGGNEALNVTWGWPSGYTPSTDTNLMGVQLFCQRGENTQVFKLGSFGQSYMTSATVCPDIAPATSANSGLSALAPNYLCSGLLPSSATSHSITGLQNGTSYGVGVAAVDKYGNISAISNIVYATPGAGMGGTGGTPGTGGSGGYSGAETSTTLTNGCACDVRGKRDRNETSGISWLAVMALMALTIAGRRIWRTPSGLDKGAVE